MFERDQLSEAQPIMATAAQEPAVQPYVLDNEHECERLEQQAIVAGFESHLRHFRIPDHAHVLDAGCGSGSMSRLLAARHPDATVTGLDLKPSYLEHARVRAAEQRLANLTFQEGDLLHLPFAAESFDLIWSKYVLYFLPQPEAAIAEFRRVIKPGGTVVIAPNHWPSVVLDPEEQPLRSNVDKVTRGLIDATLSARLPRMLRQAGFADISVRMDADDSYTTIGAIDPLRRLNLATILHAARPNIADILGGDVEADAFVATWLAYLDRADSIMMLPLWIVQGTLPPD